MKQIYDFLLRLYPAEYRTMFLKEIQIVLETSAEDCRNRGAIARAVFAIRETLGLLIGLGREWIAKLTRLSVYCRNPVAAQLPFAEERARQIVECEKNVEFFIGRVEHAIANHDFEGARFYTTEERRERERLQLLRARFRSSPDVE